jgi:hypothetical protein
LQIADKLYDREKEKAEKVFTWGVNKELIKTFKQEILIKPLPQLVSK